MAFQVGQLVKITGSFTDSASELIDPTNVFCQIKQPNGTITTYEYGVDNELIKESTGVFYLYVDITVCGTWNYRFYSTGTGQASEQDSFEVEANEF